MWHLHQKSQSRRTQQTREMKWKENKKIWMALLSIFLSAQFVPLEVALRGEENASHDFFSCVGAKLSPLALE
jgi:hypothetical protein